MGRWVDGLGRGWCVCLCVLSKTTLSVSMCKLLEVSGSEIHLNVWLLGPKPQRLG